MLQHIVEGWSKESVEAAIEDGLEQASEIVKTIHNPHIILKDLQHYEKQGFMAQLEISTEGVGLHEDYDLKDAFELTGPGSNERFRTILKDEREAFKNMIANHFARDGIFNVSFYIPDFILVPLSKADIDSHRLERGLKPFESLTGKSRRNQLGPEDEPD